MAQLVRVSILSHAHLAVCVGSSRASAAKLLLILSSHLVVSVKKTVKKTITSPFSSLVKKTVKKNPKGVKSFFQPMKKKLEKHEVIPVRIEQ